MTRVRALPTILAAAAAVVLAPAAEAQTRAPIDPASTNVAACPGNPGGALRAALDQAALADARRWQSVLEGDPVALGQYRDLLSRFCRDVRAHDPAFPCVQVLQRSYYYACPPNETILAYALDAGAPDALLRAFERYWTARAAAAAGPQAPAAAAGDVLASDFIAARPPETRRDMFKPMESPDAAAVGLLPVMIQPPADAAAPPALARDAARDVLADPHVPSAPSAVAPPPDADAASTYRYVEIADGFGYGASYAGGGAGAVWIGDGYPWTTFLGGSRYVPYVHGFYPADGYFAPVKRRSETRYWKNYGHPYPGAPASACVDDRSPRDCGRSPRAGVALGFRADRRAGGDCDARAIGAIRHYRSAVAEVWRRGVDRAACAPRPEAPAAAIVASRRVEPARRVGPSQRAAPVGSVAPVWQTSPSRSAPAVRHVAPSRTARPPRSAAPARSPARVVSRFEAPPRAERAPAPSRSTAPAQGRR